MKGQCMEHRLKTLQPFFDDVKNGSKTFELRRNDRNFKIGDTLILEEYDGTTFTGETIRKSISYVLKDCKQYGLCDEFCIIGFIE